MNEKLRLENILRLLGKRAKFDNFTGEEALVLAQCMDYVHIKLKEIKEKEALVPVAPENQAVKVVESIQEAPAKSSKKK